ncbi:MAG: alanine racemase [Actinomycetota bacterium]|nr:alanine racemase [Actinomycetota bacterium]
MTDREGRQYRPAWAVVDLVAVRANVGLLRDAAPGAALCAVVKADGYGHGAVAVARAALDAGATELAVALVEEGVALREAGVDAPVLLLSEMPVDAAGEVVARGLTPTVYSAEGVDALERVGRPVAVQLKVDTGMHRVGASYDEGLALAKRIAGSPTLRLDAVWTHFAVADEPAQRDYTDAQVDRFDEFCRALRDAGIEGFRRHASNSAGLLYTAAHYDVVRAGIAMYGYSPDPSWPEAATLRPALSLVASVSYVKTLDAGERVSYGLRYALPARSVIATVPLGYADGVPRRLSGTGASVLIGGRHCPIAGTITMDQLMVDCGPDSPVAVGDEVVLLGRQGDAVITADDWAERTGTISYEILCGIGPRVPRVYRP